MDAVIENLRHIHDPVTRIYLVAALRHEVRIVNQATVGNQDFVLGNMYVVGRAHTQTNFRHHDGGGKRSARPLKA